MPCRPMYAAVFVAGASLVGLGFDLGLGTAGFIGAALMGASAVLGFVASIQAENERDHEREVEIAVLAETLEKLRGEGRCS